MKNKNTYIVLLVIFAAICAFNFTMTVLRIQKDQALNEMTAKERTQWLEQKENKEYYQTLVKNSLSLGLDLQGGMYVTLEIGIDKVLQGLAGAEADSTFNRAIRRAREEQKNSNAHFVDLFYKNLQAIDKDATLVEYFGGNANIDYDADTDDYIDFLKNEADEAVSRSLNIIRQRIDQYGVASPNIQRQQGGRIIVELPGVRNTDRIKELLKKTAKLEFWKTYPASKAFPVVKQINERVKSIVGVTDTTQQDTAASDSAALAKGDTTQGGDTAATASGADLLAEGDQGTQQDDAASDTGQGTPTTSDDILGEGGAEGEGQAQLEGRDKDFRSENPFFARLNPPGQGSIRPNSPVMGFAKASDTAQINEWLAMDQVQDIIPRDMKFIWTARPQEEVQGLNQAAYVLIALKRSVDKESGAALSGEVVTNTSVVRDPNTNQIKVSMSMNTEGTQKWSRLTGEYKGKSIAVVLDNRVQSYPVVQSQISTGSTEISGNFSRQEAEDLANILKAGHLPAPARIKGEEIVGPSLGEQTVQKGFLSFIGGFLAVILFMFWYYRRVGLIADIALIVNLFFVVGICSAMQIVLTLPGIAGIVLSMGMAVDANVLIYERIREELEQGKSIKGAIDSGFKNAFSAIVDGNITTFLTGVILFSFGVGPIRGFAVTLIIGIITTLISALLVTRMILEYISSRPEAKELSFGVSGITGFFRNTKYRIMGSRKAAYGVGAGLILTSLVLFVTLGFKLGVDFEGGRQYVIEFNQAVDAAEVKDDLTQSLGGKKPVVRTIGGTNQLLITTNYLADSSGADEKVQAALQEGLSDIGKFEILRNTKVGPTIASDIRRSAIYAVIISLFVIFLYIFARFQRWQFGLSALVSLALNVTVVLGVFSLLGSIELMPFSVEINQPIIAALLTIVGYTINDTVVVFDRIRENMRYDKIGSPLPELYNKAVNDTLARTVVTSFTTLLTAFILFLFGGEALKSFMLALILGILVGTLSSIFVASPLSMDLLKSTVGKYNPDAQGAKGSAKGGNSNKSSGTKKAKSQQQKKPTKAT